MVVKGLPWLRQDQSDGDLVGSDFDHSNDFGARISRDSFER